VAVASARDAEQAASHTAAQEMNRRHAVDQQLAVLQQTLQQVWLLLLSVCVSCFTYLTIQMLSDLNFDKQRSANLHMLLHVHALKRGPSSCRKDVLYLLVEVW